MFNKSAPEITGLVLLIIGILVLILTFDSIISFIKAKIQRNKHKPDDIDMMFPDETKESETPNNK